MKDTPWWGVPVVSGVFAFIGVLLAQTVTIYSERRKGRREDERRWHAERRIVYARFATGLRRDLLRIERMRDKSTPNDGASFTENLESDLEEISLLASQGVIQAAFAAMTYHDRLDTASTTTDDDSFSRLLADATAARKSFVEKARTELGITRPTLRFYVSSDSALGFVGQILLEVWRGMVGTYYPILGIRRRKID